jgi:hypothetical protein
MCTGGCWFTVANFGDIMRFSMGFSVGCLEVSEFYSPTKIITLFLLVPTLTFYVILDKEHKNPIKIDGQNITLKTNRKAKERPKDAQHVGTKEGGELVLLMVGSYLSHSPSNVVNMHIIRFNNNRRFRTSISCHPIYLSITKAKAY